MKKAFSLVLLSLLFLGGAAAQQFAQQSTPPSFQFKNSLVLSSRVYKAALKYDVEQLRREDMERIKDGHPMRVAVGVAVDVEFESAAADWLSLPDGERIWQRGIRSEGASGLIVSFDELYIPEGGELFVYTADRRQVQRFDHTTNPGGGVYATTRLMCDEVTLEYVRSTVSDETPRIKVSGVGYIYRNTKALGDDLSCFIDINCEEGADWQVQKNGVVGLWIQLQDDWYICSGSLVNNARQDGTPYILTAHHCIDGYTSITLPTMEFEFFKESTQTNTCHDKSDESTLTRTLIGCELVADIPLSGASDGTLLRLTENIPADWQVYYNGWDARGTAATSGVSIHHPNSLVKKVSTYTQTLRSGQYVEQDEYGKITKGAKDAHWEVYWAKTTNGHSVTYGGSSGSPLFNQDGLIVGTLTGGSSYCELPNQSDMYGKLSYHWNQYSDSEQHFKNYLDPDNTGTLVLEGYDPHAAPALSAPVARAATELSTNGFTANWETVKGATGYMLHVYSVQGGEGTAGTATVDFAGEVLPAGWATNAKEYYRSNSTGYYSEAPSLKMSNTGTSVLESPAFEGDIKSVSFWYRGASTDANSKLAVSARGKGLWEEVKVIQPLNNNAGQTVTISENELPEGCTTIQFEYTKAGGNCALDDIVVEYGSPAVVTDLAGYENRPVGNVLSHRVEGVSAFAGPYFYTVQATDGTLLSKVSNVIEVGKDPIVGLPVREVLSAVFVNNENIVVRRDDSANVPVALYSITGAPVWSQTMSGHELCLPKAYFAKGIYFVKVGGDTHKIIIH